MGSAETKPCEKCLVCGHVIFVMTPPRKGICSDLCRAYSDLEIDAATYLNKLTEIGKQYFGMTTPKGVDSIQPVDLSVNLRTRVVSNNVMPRVGGKAFRCQCGANVFTEIEEEDGSTVFVCNGCSRAYSGTP